MIQFLDMGDPRWELYRDAVSILRSMRLLTQDEYLEEICKIYH